jgi:hypothetical protein
MCVAWGKVGEVSSTAAVFRQLLQDREVVILDYYIRPERRQTLNEDLLAFRKMSVCIVSDKVHRRTTVCIHASFCVCATHIASGAVVHRLLGGLQLVELLVTVFVVFFLSLDRPSCSSQFPPYLTVPEEQCGGRDSLHVSVLDWLVCRVWKRTDEQLDATVLFFDCDGTRVGQLLGWMQRRMSAVVAYTGRGTVQDCKVQVQAGLQAPPPSGLKENCELMVDAVASGVPVWVPCTVTEFREQRELRVSQLEQKVKQTELRRQKAEAKPKPKAARRTPPQTTTAPVFRRRSPQRGSTRDDSSETEEGGRTPTPAPRMKRVHDLPDQGFLLQ